MSHVRPAPRAASARPVVPNRQVTPRAPAPRGPPPRLPTVTQQPVIVRNRVPQYLPVLQPPLFPKEHEFYEGEHYPEEYETYPTVPLFDQRRALTRRYTNHTRLSSSLHRYARQPSARFGRRADPPYHYYRR